ncbi:MAG: DNA polymerase III subunit chi [Gammaproteobacteria bacterium]|nr:DNA polymerase III subunit chi [Gammaproteobacteria bacterium]MCW8987950.1 DNA polymerase III subunit chi [Gammaproteobacteria bacterium]
MTRIDFYIIEQGSETATETFICRLTEKAWSQNNDVYIHTLDEHHAAKYDELLWTFAEESFVPHHLIQNENTLAHSKNILIGHSASKETPASCHDVLINLDHDTPSFFSQFERVAEIIANDEMSRSKGRERYQFYRDRGYALETHKMSL